MKKLSEDAKVVSVKLEPEGIETIDYYRISQYGTTLWSRSGMIRVIVKQFPNLVEFFREKFGFPDDYSGKELVFFVQDYFFKAKKLQEEHDLAIKSNIIPFPVNYLKELRIENMEDRR